MPIICRRYHNRSYFSGTCAILSHDKQKELSMNFNIRCLVPLLTVITLALTVRATLQTSAPVPSWKAHDMRRTRPPVVIPGTSTLPASPPSDAIVLFDGKNLRNWRNEDRGDPKWIVRNGYMDCLLYTSPSPRD